MKRPRRAPFVVTFAVAAMSTACGGSTDSDPGTGGGTGGGGANPPGYGGYGGSGAGGFGGYSPDSSNPPGFPCPVELPAEGSACPQGAQGDYWGGTTCAFLDPCGGPEPFFAECNLATGTWHLLGETDCACPDSPPVVGTACSTSQFCDYPSTCCPLAYQCLEGVWVEAGVSCNPPPIVCPTMPPPPGSPCESCAFGQCTWDQCVNGGSITNGTCVNGAWQIGLSPCFADAGSGT